MSLRTRFNDLLFFFSFPIGPTCRVVATAAVSSELEYADAPFDTHILLCAWADNDVAAAAVRRLQRLRCAVGDRVAGRMIAGPSRGDEATEQRKVVDTAARSKNGGSGYCVAAEIRSLTQSGRTDDQQARRRREAKRIASQGTWTGDARRYTHT